MSVPGIQTKLALAALCTVSAISCSSHGFPGRLRASKTVPPDATDTVCDRPVRNHEILFKPTQCSADLDLKSLGDHLTAFLKQNTPNKNDVITVSRVTSNCILLAKSSNRNVTELMQAFQVFTAKSNFDSTSEFKDFQVVDFEPNFLIQLDNDIDGSNSPELAHNTTSEWWFGGPPGSNAANAWTSYGTGSGDIVVGILDTGIVYDHPDLAPANVWKATMQIDLPANNLHCLVGARGLDISGATKTCDPKDILGHGTHVAGIVGATGTGPGVVGVSQRVTLLAIKIFDSNQLTYVDRVIAAIDIATQLKTRFGINLRVLNNSYTVDVPCAKVNLLQSVIQEAGDNGILFVAAAGESLSNRPDLADNDSIKRYPSAFNFLDNVISVTAVDEAGELADGLDGTAHYGKERVDLGAPGSRIYSTDIAANGSYSSRSGTSMATPFVSGSAALILSVRDCSTLTVSGLKDLILTRVTPATALAGKTVASGTLNVYSSISNCPKSP